jgi:hypothetical protein
VGILRLPANFKSWCGATHTPFLPFPDETSKPHVFVLTCICCKRIFGILLIKLAFILNPHAFLFSIGLTAGPAHNS